MYRDVLTASGWPEALPRPPNRRLKRREPVDTWFGAYELAADTFALLEPHHYEEVISYVIVGQDRALLFDTGLGIGDIRAEVERLTDKPLVVVNSHSHYDHVGGNYQFRESWAFDEAFEVARVERGVPPGEARAFIPPGSYTYLPPSTEAASYQIHRCSVSRRLHDLEEIELGGRTLTVHHTPGHSPGSICLLDDLQGLLFTGDTIYPGTLYAHFPESDFDAYLLSLRRLKRLSETVTWLAPGHNEARLDGELVGAVVDAFGHIAEGHAVGKPVGDARIFTFDRFRVALALDA